MIDRQYSSYCFLASELPIEKTYNILDRQQIASQWGLQLIFRMPQFYTAHAHQRITFVNWFSSSMIMKFTNINNTVRAIFIYLSIYALMSGFQLLTKF
jgi:hypothetical protein